MPALTAREFQRVFYCIRGGGIEIARRKYSRLRMGPVPSITGIEYIYILMLMLFVHQTKTGCPSWKDQILEACRGMYFLTPVWGTCVRINKNEHGRRIKKIKNK
jgi:hypothetical protein